MRTRTRTRATPVPSEQGVTGIYQLKITLRGIRPPVWRRVEVPGEFTLRRLHDVIQAAMGWFDCHLHQFTIGEVSYGEPDPDGWNEFRDDRKSRLRQVVRREQARFLYEYDFGDSWEHEILVEKIAAPEAGARYPRCIAGRRSAPPEDSGGAWGYAELLVVLADPKHPEHEEMKEWAGERFDPERFELEAVNRVLARM